ncbi:MAG: DnaJ family domain-containing protein, partial [Gammaproteobacteria bacterium]|nr:DnaJ family domain-containing protein [Gammaproteobacteria bacterium]
MLLIDRLVEERIRKAQENGEFDNLPGAGKPLKLDDDSMVPKELRAGYRILKNAGYVPQEVQLRKEIHSVEQLIALSADENEKETHKKRYQILLLQLETLSPERK